jgi:hypothetical protein
LLKESKRKKGNFSEREPTLLGIAPYVQPPSMTHHPTLICDISPSLRPKSHEVLFGEQTWFGGVSLMKQVDVMEQVN